MRLLVFEDRFDDLYGAQENVLLLAQLCAERGHQVVFATSAEGRLADEARRRGLEVAIVAAPSALLRFEGAVLGGGLVDKARTAVALVRYSFRLHRAARRHQVDVVVPSAVRPAVLLLLTGLRRRPRIVLFAQNSIDLGLFGAVAGLSAWRIGLIADGARSTFPTWVRPRLESRFRRLASGRDMSPFDHLAPRTESGPRLELVTVCSITERKGLAELFEAVAGRRDVKVTVVGGSTGAESERYFERIRAYAAAESIDVDFVGWRDDVVPFLAAADAFVLASFDEGLPGVLIEAMAAGLACITTDVGGAGELVERCEAGLVVPAGDIDALGAAIGRFVDEPTQRAAWARAGFDNVRRHYGLDQFVESFESIVGEALD